VKQVVFRLLQGALKRIGHLLDGFLGA